MKFAAYLGMFFAGLLAVAAQTPLSRLERVYISGAGYIRLDDWARANGGQIKWVTPKREVRALLPAGTVVLATDSRKSTLKGINVWLSAPVVLRGTSAYVAVTDLETTIQPLLFPTRAAAARPIRTIVLDPGHGGKDPGNLEGLKQEKYYTLLLAGELRDLLTKAGFKVHLTRATDTLIDLNQRPSIARQRGADLFISLHFNSADGPGGSTVQGSEVYCLTPAQSHSTNDRAERGRPQAQPGNRHDSRNLQLAYQIQKALVTKAGSADRGVKRARYAVLKFAEMPAVLIEAAFMTHAGDAKKIYNATQRRAIAQSIVDAVQAYKKLVEG